MKVLNGGKGKPRAYTNMQEILEKLDIPAEYRLIQSKESRLPKMVRDAVVSIYELAEQRGMLKEGQAEN